MGRRYTYNTAIAANMELLNALAKFEDHSPEGHLIRQEALEKVCLMLSPIVPHITQRLWEALGHTGILATTPWPKVDETALVQDRLELVVQVNGKLRSKISVAPDADTKTVEAAALGDETVQRFLEGKPAKKVIVVPRKLVNIVI